MPTKTFDALEHWVGMPAYEAGEKAPELVIRFRSVRSKGKFIRLMGLKPDPRNNGSAWWPPRGKMDRRSVIFEG
jgi:hypothetical protein